MGTDYKKMYLELNGLLEDICEFLSSEKLENLSVKDKRLAESLINRSKKQLQEIAKLQTTDVYVPMDNKKAIAEEHGECDGEVYSSVDDCIPKVEVPYIEEVVALSYLEKGQTRSRMDLGPHEIIQQYTRQQYPQEFANFPARDASQGMKYGFISMRRKFLLGFEVMKRIYATIRKEWLLIYWGEKDSKPMCTFNLHDYQAKESDGDKNYFELYSSDKKVYHFMALTHKDMLQWVVSINKCHDDLVLRTKNLHITESENLYSNDGITNNGQEEIYEEGEDIYAELPDVPENIRKTMTTSTNTFVNKPPLPLGRPGSNKVKLPIKVPPPVVKPITPTKGSSSEDLGSYEEIFTHKSNMNGITMPKQTFNDDGGSYHDMSGNLKSNKSLSNSTKSLDSFSVGSGDSDYQVFAVVNREVQRISQMNSKMGKTGGEPSAENHLPPPPPEAPCPRKESTSTEDDVISPALKPKVKQKPSIKKIPPPPPKRSFRKD